jgi:hypothetical protein
MKIKQLIEVLSKLPEYADVAVEMPDGDGVEYASFAVELGDDYPDKKLALVRIIPA